MTTVRQRGIPGLGVPRGILLLLGLLGGLGATGVAPAAEERVRLTLYTGEVLEGRVYDLRNQYLEIHRALGSTVPSMIPWRNSAISAATPSIGRKWGVTHSSVRMLAKSNKWKLT